MRGNVTAAKATPVQPSSHVFSDKSPMSSFKRDVIEVGQVCAQLLGVADGVVALDAKQTANTQVT
jgi:hypothetical protein